MQRVLGSNRNVSRLWLAIAFVLAAILLFLSFKGVHWDEMLDTARQAQPVYLVLAFLIVTISYSLRALRWRILLSAELRIAPITVFWATIIGYLGNSFLPARAGELIRSAIIGRSMNASTSYVLATALTERIVDVVALVLICVVALMSLPNLPAWLDTSVRVMAVLGVGGLGALFIVPYMEGLLQQGLGRLPIAPLLKARLSAMLEKFLLGMRPLHNPARMLGFTTLTAIIWLADASFAIITAHALSLSLGLAQALLLLAALGLSSAAPSTPGYLGIYQFVAVTVLAPFGFNQSQALAYIIIYQAISYAVVIVWGAVGLWRLGMMRRSVVAEAENPHVV